MAIDNNDIKKLERLTRLQLSEQERAEAVVAINQTLELLDTLAKANVDGVDALAHAHAPNAALRCREPTAKAGLPRERLLANAPQSEDGYFVVPKVVE